MEMFATLDTGLLFEDIQQTKPEIEGTSIEEFAKTWAAAYRETEGDVARNTRRLFGFALDARLTELQVGSDTALRRASAPRPPPCQTVRPIAVGFSGWPK